MEKWLEIERYCKGEDGPDYEAGLRFLKVLREEV
jgi:hypothetical protein